LPEYEVSVKFHIFPFKKLHVSAENEKAAREIADSQAKIIRDSVEYTIDEIKPKKYLIDEFLH